MPKIEGYMFEEHDLVRASATECMCNLVLSTEVRHIFNNNKIYWINLKKSWTYQNAVCPQVQKLYLATGNDRLKLLVLYSGEEDERLRRAAAGTLAMLTAEQPELCARIPGTVRKQHFHMLLFLYTFFEAHSSHCPLFSDDPLVGDCAGSAPQWNIRPTSSRSGHSSEHDAGREKSGWDTHWERNSGDSFCPCKGRRGHFRSCVKGCSELSG